MALLVLGCREAPVDLQLGSCPALAARLRSCGRLSAPADAVSRRCEQYPTDFQDHVDCALYPDCQGFTRCFDGAVAAADPRRRAQRLTHYLEDIRGALADGDFSEARELCGDLLADPEPDAEAVARCAQVAARAVEVLAPRVRALRDGGAQRPQGAPTGLEVCPELLAWAGRVSAPQRDEARQLCDEAAVALAVAPVLAGDAPLERVPALGCDAALAQAAGLGTAFGEALGQRLRDACGQLAVERLLEGTAGCDHRLRRAMEVLETAPRPWPALTERLRDRARARCGA